MVVVNTISLLEDSPFKNSEQVLLLEDATGEVQAEEQVENSSDEEDVSLESRELSRRIDSHVVVLDDDQPRNEATASALTAQPTVTSNSGGSRNFF